ncbi:MAG: HlyC/CorC family transporter [Lachnospiraceae bacterium]|nr:HlyC/CorC family transporter [Lachnospiraceae bacterium]
MDTSDAILLAILFVLLFLSAFFSSAETALTCTNKVKMKALADEGNKKAARVLSILESPGKMLSTILIGNNLVNISITSIATTLTIKLFGSVYVGAVTGLLTIILLLFGEIVPKTAANINAEKTALTYSPFIQMLMFLLTPVIFIVDKMSGFLLKLMRISSTGAYNPMTENELKTYVEVSHEDGAIESEEREMILNVFDLGDSLAKDIMIPRIDMTAIDVEASYKELCNLFKNTLYSRIPVYEEETEQIIGSVTLKDFFLVNKKSDFHIRDIMRDIYYTYETKKTDDLFNEMRESANNIAVVLDEYGVCVGLITLEDLLEEIVGEIRDEYDGEEKELLKEIGEGTYDIAGAMKLDDINDALMTEYDSEDYDSIGGIMIEQLDRVPRLGESVTLEDGTIITASVISKNRVMRVTLKLPPKEEEAEEVSDKKESYENSCTNSEEPEDALQ